VGNLRDPSRDALSVGGPGGIHIQGGNVQINGVPMAGQVAPAPPPAPAVSVDLTRVSPLIGRYSGVLAAGLCVVGGAVVLSAAVVISVLGLPWLLLVVPAALAAVLVAVAVAAGRVARGRVTTGGVDPDTERRILDLAVASAGRVTTTAVARALSMPLAEADRVLGALARSGHVSVENDPSSGVVVYVFPEIDAGLVR
jgi:hypothetical protein